MSVLSMRAVVESPLKGSVMEFSAVYAVVTIAYEQKWDGELILVFVAAEFSQFFKGFR